MYKTLNVLRCHPLYSQHAKLTKTDLGTKEIRWSRVCATLRSVISIDLERSFGVNQLTSLQVERVTSRQVERVGPNIAKT